MHTMMEPEGRIEQIWSEALIERKGNLKPDQLSFQKFIQQGRESQAKWTQAIVLTDHGHEQCFTWTGMGNNSPVQELKGCLDTMYSNIFIIASLKH